MLPALLSLAGLLLATSIGPSAAAAQAPDQSPPAVEAPVERGTGAPAALPAAAAQTEYPAGAAGLPPRTPPPATLRAYWHLFGAFAATILLIFGYALSVGRRFARLEDEVTRLSRAQE